MRSYFVRRYSLLLVLLATGFGLVACHHNLDLPPEKLPDPARLMKITKPSYKLNQGAPLDEQTASQAAERFIADNGYTDFPPFADPRQLTFESIEVADDPQLILRFRHNSLEPKAYAISNHGRDGAGWTVGFRTKRGGLETGRSVSMDSDGGNIRMDHQDVYLQKLDKKVLP